MLEEYFEKRQVGKEGKVVKVAVRAMTQEEARQAYPYRPPSKYAESRFGGNEMTDDRCLLINEMAERCKMCKAPTRKEYLHENMCPDCDGRSEKNGVDPHKPI